MTASPSRDLLRFDRPARAWTEALPIGSGLLGAMCWGEVGDERVQLNHTTAWSGGPMSERSGDLPSAERSQAAVEASRSAVDRGDWLQADSSLGGIQHGYPQSFLPVVDLHVRVGGDGAVADYRRSLDLATAVHETSYLLDGDRIRISTRASHPHDVLLMTVESARPVRVEIEVQSLLRVLDRDVTPAGDLLLRFPSDVAPDKMSSAEPVRYEDGAQRALEGAVVVRVDHDGVPDGELVASSVTRADVWLAIETTAGSIGAPLVGDARDAAARAAARVEVARAEGARRVADSQERDHRELYGRCSLELGDGRAESTLDRLAAAFEDESTAMDRDPGLVELLFRFGRYLLICSSREGGRPANLQGIWNDLLQPPWSSDYTTNINLEMNYWLAEHTDLVECTGPLFDYVEALADSGTETAQRVFGLPGWAAFHCSDVWAYSQSVGDGTHDPSWAFWPFAGPWLLQHFRERLLHGGDLAVAERAWPLARASAEFHLAFLVDRPDGSLGTNPSTSPENHFRATDGTVGATAASSTMDIALTRDLLRFVLELAQLLGTTGDPVSSAAAAALKRLPAPTIGADGLVVEWPDTRLAPDPDHRHVAHLYFVHPSDEPYGADLAEAARRSLDARGDESTGWSLVWKATMFARLHEPARVADLFRLLFRDATHWRGPYVGGLYPNLFAAHPPFQIDANLGLVTAVSEMLVQSHRGEIELLPAMPHSLGAGRVSGLVARPGVRVALEWDAQGLVAAELIPRVDRAIRVRLGDDVLDLDGRVGAPIRLGRLDFTRDGGRESIA